MARIYVKKVPAEVEFTCRGCCFENDVKNCMKLQVKYGGYICFVEYKIFKKVGYRE